MADPVAQKALAKARELDRSRKWLDYSLFWKTGALLVARDGSVIARPGAIVSNTSYYEFIFQNQVAVQDPRLSMVSLTGENRGKVFFEPVMDAEGNTILADRWMEIAPADASGVLLAVPPPKPLDLFPASEESLFQLISNGFSLAEQARQSASLGKTDEAKRFLSMKGASARANNDASWIFLKILYSFGVLSEKDKDDLVSQTLVPFGTAIGEALKAIEESKTWLSRWINKTAEIGKMTAVVYKGIGDERVRRVVGLYGSLVRRNQAEKSLVESLTPDDPLRKSLDTLLKKSMLAQERFEQKLVSIGLSMPEVRKEAGLSGLPVILVAFAAKFLTIQVLLSVIRFIIIQVVIGILLDAIAEAVFSKLINAAKLKELEAETQKLMEEQQKARITARFQVLLQSIQVDLDLMGGAASMADSDPVILSRVNYLKNQKENVILGKKLEGPLQAAEKTSRPFWPVILAGLILGGIIALGTRLARPKRVSLKA